MKRSPPGTWPHCFSVTEQFQGFLNKPFSDLAQNKVPPKTKDEKHAMQWGQLKCS